MTRKIFLLLLILMPFSMVYGQKNFDNLDKMIQYFSKVKGVEYDVKDKLPMTLPFVEKVDVVESLIIEDCDEEDIRSFASIDMTGFKGYEVMFRVVDEDDVVTLLVKPSKKKGDEQFSELIFVVQEPEEGLLVCMKGLFSKPDSSILYNLK